MDEATRGRAPLPVFVLIPADLGGFLVVERLTKPATAAVYVYDSQLVFGRMVREAEPASIEDSAPRFAGDLGDCLDFIEDVLAENLPAEAAADRAFYGGEQWRGDQLAEFARQAEPDRAATTAKAEEDRAWLSWLDGAATRGPLDLHREWVAFREARANARHRDLCNEHVHGRQAAAMSQSLAPHYTVETGKGDRRFPA